MKHTERKYNKTHRKKKRSHKKTKKIFINKHIKTKKQHGSGKYKPSDIYNIDQFIMNDCLSILKREVKPSEKGIFSKMFKSSDPYVKCRRSMRVFNTEKMPPDEYLKYRQIIEVAKNDPYYSNPKRGNVEDIGNNYIFDYILNLHSKLLGGGTRELQNLLRVVNPCYLISILTLVNYYNFIDHLADKSKLKKEEGKYGSSVTTGLKRRVDVETICDWVRDTNFNLFKLKSPQELVALFNSYYPINCPYNDQLAEFEILNIESTQILQTNNRYTNNSSWDLYLHITFGNFYDAYFSKAKYETSIVYSSLIGESFIRRLSTNIIGNNGEIIFKSTDGDGDFYEQNKKKILLDKDDFATKHFNKFIQKLNEVGGTNKFDNTTINYEDKSTIGNLPTRLVGTLNYNTVTSNKFIENVIKFLAISMVPIIVNVTRIITGSKYNYYGLFYHYYEERYKGYCYFLYNNINEINNTPITNNEMEIINNFINTNIPNDNYNKCVLRNDYSVFPDCRIIDIQNNALFCFSQTLITLPFPPFPVIGRYIQIMKYENILSDNVNDVAVSINSLILWNGNINTPTVDDVYNEEKNQYFSTELTVGEVIQNNVGYTFYEGFLKPILSSLKPESRVLSIDSVNSNETTPRNTIIQNDIPIIGVTRDSNESIGSIVELG